MAETTWHLIGEEPSVRSRAPFAVLVGKESIAIFHHEGRFHAISNVCNHKAGPLSEGMVEGDYVTCPWHGWVYNIKTGKGEPGYEGDAVPAYEVEARNGNVYVATPAISKRGLLPHPPKYEFNKEPRKPGERPRVVGISTTSMDAKNPRFSTSDHLLEVALQHAATNMGAHTRLLRLRELNFRECEGNYSKAAHACTWPCAITERDGNDQLGIVYDSLLYWADVVLIATPIRWGNASSLYYKMIERMNCVQNQITIRNKVLVQKKVAGFIITGGQDNVQAVAGQMLMFFSELGFVFPPFPFIGHSRGWTAEDMENNVKMVRRSGSLKHGAETLVERTLEMHKSIAGMKWAASIERAGRKASAAVLGERTRRAEEAAQP
ncbi:MAG: Rieske 2Fe-2S domain-containing protein [Bacteroidota bacterium]